MSGFNLESGTKRCLICKEIKPLTGGFSKIHRNSNRYQSYCKRCSSIEYKIWKSQNSAKIEKYRRDWAQNNLSSMILMEAKSRAKSKRLDFNLELSDIVVPKVCPVLGMPLVNHKGLGKRARYYDDSPSIDRIDNTKGYVKGNVIIVSWRANNIKTNATIEELRKVYEFYRDLQNCTPEAPLIG